MTTTTRPSALTEPDRFVHRHVGPDESDIKTMLGVLGFATLDELIAAVVPESIRRRRALAIHGGRSEFEALSSLRSVSRRNKVFKSYLGMGYSDTITPPVIQRNILENPGWYTA